MRSVLLVATTIAALAAPASALGSDRPPIPPVICGPDMMCHVEPLPEIPPVLR